MPTQNQMDDFAQARFDRALQDSPYLRARLQPEPPRRKGADSKRLKRIGPGYLFLRGADSRRQIASVDADLVVLDEFDQMAEGTFELAQKRLALEPGRTPDRRLDAALPGGRGQRALPAVRPAALEGAGGRARERGPLDGRAEGIGGFGGVPRSAVCGGLRRARNTIVWRRESAGRCVMSALEGIVGALSSLGRSFRESAMAVRRPTEETARLGEAIYERDIRAQVEVDHDGEYVAIDVNSGCWAVAEDLLAAASDLRSRYPDVVDVWSVRVGHRALRHFGGRPLRRAE